MKKLSVLAAKRLEITRCAGAKSLLDVAAQMDEDDISSIVVTDSQGYLRGIVTRTDIVRMALAHPDSWYEITCDAAMTEDVITAPVTATLDQIARLVQEKHIHRVVVVEETEAGKLRPLAVISDHDIIYHLVHATREVWR